MLLLVKQRYATRCLLKVLRVSLRHLDGTTIPSTKIYKNRFLMEGRAFIMSQNTHNSALLTRHYLLDSNIVAAYLLGKRAAFELAHTWVKNDEAATSILVYGEVCEYFKRLPIASERLVALRTLLEKVYPYPLINSTMEQYAEIRLAMRAPKGPGLIGDIDTLIAATALDNGLTLVTTDSDFTRVPNLSVRYIPRTALK
jgi:predicted nucleic acid-binding protein